MKTIGVISEDVQLCHQLAIMCSENRLNVLFLNDSNEERGDIDIVVVDIDIGIKSAIEKCNNYKRLGCMVFGAIEVPKKSVILSAKTAGCLIVLTKTNFSSNLLDIIKKQI